MSETQALLATLRNNGYTDITAILEGGDYAEFLDAHAGEFNAFLAARSDQDGTNLQVINSLDDRLANKIMTTVVQVANGQEADFSQYSAAELTQVQSVIRNLDFAPLKGLIVSSAPDQLAALVNNNPDIAFGALNGDMIQGIANTIRPLATNFPDQALNMAMSQLSTPIRQSGSYEQGDNLDSFVNFAVKNAIDTIER